MKAERFLIQSSTRGYLDGWSGDNDWDRTYDKRTAWAMPRKEAQARLLKVLETVPDAKVIDA